MRLGDVVLLPALGAATQQDDQRVPVLSEVQPVAGPLVDPILLHPCPDAFGVGQVAPFQACQRHGHLGGRLGVQVIEPVGERAAAAGIQKLPDLHSA